MRKRVRVEMRVLKVAGYDPLYVRNITDVDDKTIRGSTLAGTDLNAFTTQWTERFHQDCQQLNMLVPDVEPRATDHLREQIEMVQQLIEKGHAYLGPDGSVYFRVGSFPDYGKLSHFDPQALQQQATNSAGTLNLADEYDRDSVADFALWKARKADDGEVFWDSPWGQGRPGWHLECSAMSLKYLGNTFDLHGGGEDLCFPHHENEIAQSEAATGKPFASHWVHSVHLLVEGRKMAKSLGNFFVLEDLKAKGFHPMEIRLAMLGGHYRQQINFTLSSIESARSGLSKIESAVSSLLEHAQLQPFEWKQFVLPQAPDDWGHFKAAWDSLCHDLNTPAVLGGLFNGLRQARQTASSPREARASLQAAGVLLYVLGLQLFSRTERDSEAPDEVKELAEQRWVAKTGKDFVQADALREQISRKGWLVVDRPDGYSLKPNS